MSHALLWRVKASLFGYIRSLNDGCVETSEGAEIAESGEFRFPFDEASPTTHGVFRYRGVLHWRAHDGLMDVTLSSVWVAVAPTAWIAALVRIPGEPAARVTLATMEVNRLDKNAWQGSAVRLTAEGALALGALQYYEGQQIDDALFSAPINSGD
ncbi:MAG: HtaA domain-containing protein [Leucobacter sp.]